MRTLFLLALASVELGGAFGVAAAEGVAVSSGEIEVTISVVVEASPVNVVAYLVDPGDDQATVALGPRAGGEYAGTAISERADLVVIFEAIWADGSSETSRPVTLTELGLDPAVLLDEAGVVDTDDEELTLDAATERWGWAAVGLGAAALSLLALWALAEYPRRRRSEAEETVDPG